MKKKIVISLSITIVILVSIAANMFASAQTVFNTWNANYTWMQAWTPVGGTLSTSFSTTKVGTLVDFQLNQSNVNAILSRNSQGHYFGIDLKCHRTVPTAARALNAQAITSDLPNLYIDFDGWPVQYEAEAIALGTVTARYYWVHVSWDDNRLGTHQTANNEIHLQAEISQWAGWPINEYNPVGQGGELGYRRLVELPIGQHPGMP